MCSELSKRKAEKELTSILNDWKGLKIEGIRVIEMKVLERIVKLFNDKVYNQPIDSV